ncbi:MAG: PQQ-dependent sugar dehydrogenase [Chloroflexi bacterium]|nr:PQQ-dependent sugar dehydrogenase [Chloroflexota bacterium]
MKKLRIAMSTILVLCLGICLAQEPEEAIVSRASAPSAEDVVLSEIASGFNRPLYVTHAGDGSERLFVLEQTGKVWVIKDGVRARQPFLDISGLVTATANRLYSEQGLLGLAFHPEYASNGRFFVNYTDRSGTTVVARYQVSLSNPEVADAGSGQIIFQLRQPYANHNGGHIDFGPDGYLYISLGDGGSANDPLGAGQNLRLLLGSIIRIDVDGALPYVIPPDNPFVGDDSALDEIWAYGLRNVWRFSFDRATGDMYLADVGQNLWEEVNFQAADSAGGENYGWNVWEGTQLFAGGSAKEHVPPVFEYPHSLGCSITGGYVYRGGAIPQMEAVYLFGDYCTGRMWAMYRDPDLNWQAEELANTGMAISSFGEDEAGEIYVIDYSGTIYRIDPAVAS